jgi:hypothetical protein
MKKNTLKKATLTKNKTQKNNKELVKKGDVFYIVDGTYSEDSNMYPPDYKPKNVRYLFHVTDIFKSNNRFFLNYTFCRPKNVTYNPKDYNTNSCGDFGYDEIVYENALELINSKMLILIPFSLNSLGGLGNSVRSKRNSHLLLPSSALTCGGITPQLVKPVPIVA